MNLEQAMKYSSRKLHAATESELETTTQVGEYLIMDNTDIEAQKFERTPSFCFVYRKNGVIKIFNLEDCRKYEEYLATHGWEHLHTIDPILWMTAITKASHHEVNEMVRSLKGFGEGVF